MTYFFANPKRHKSNTKRLECGRFTRCAVHFNIGITVRHQEGNANTIDSTLSRLLDIKDLSPRHPQTVGDVSFLVEVFDAIDG